MTWRIVYGIGLWVSIAATCLTIASIVKPLWLSYHSPDDGAPGRRYTYGLHQRCNTVTGGGGCEPFPEPADCVADRRFCSLWRTAGFLMNLAVLVECTALVACAVVVAGGKQRRDRGWKVVGALLVAAAALQAGVTGIVIDLVRHDDRFFEGWGYDTSFALSAASWALQLFTAAGLLASAVWLPEEGGYELIPDRDGPRAGNVQA